MKSCNVIISCCSGKCGLSGEGLGLNILGLRAEDLALLAWRVYTLGAQCQVMACRVHDLGGLEGVFFGCTVSSNSGQGYREEDRT